MKVDRIPGLNLAARSHEVGLGGLTTADNVDLSRDSKVSRRPGRQLVYGGVIDAAWGDGDDFLFVEGGELKRLGPDYVAEVLVPGLDRVTYLTATRAFGRLYWNTDRNRGVIEGSTVRGWGIPRPRAPVVEETTGILPFGRYLVALAHVSDSGEEGPLSEHTLFVGQGGVVVDNPGGRTNLYLSTLDGQMLYLAVPEETGPFITYAGDGSDLSIPPDNEHRTNLPIGRRLVGFGGRIWASLPNILVYTDPYSEHTDLRSNFIPFPGTINDFGYVDDGLYVATETETYFLSGRDPGSMEPVRVSPYGAIAGTFTQVSGRLIGEGVNAEALMWLSPRGVCAGLPGGTLLNLTERRVNEFSGTKGTAVLRQANGQSHFLAVVQN